MKTLRLGAKGRHVRYLQQLLCGHGLQLTADGDFGPNTLAAVRTFQAQAGLSTDGVVGDRTWSALRVDARTAVPERLIAEGQVELRQLIGDLYADEPRARVLKAAISYLGAEESPLGSNKGPAIRALVRGYPEFWQYTPGKHAPPWCAIYLSSCIRLGLGIDDWADTPMGTWLGGVASWEEWADKAVKPGGFQAFLGSVPVGAIFTMARSGSGSDDVKPGHVSAVHCGFILADNGSTITTFDGNIGDAVGTRERKKSDLRGFINWWQT